ncbi:MAG: ABC transporter permease, partial [Gammaproteobacteria bacterium]
MKPLDRVLGSRHAATVLSVGTFLVLAGLFFSLNGRHPLAIFQQIVVGGFGDSFALSVTLTKTIPIVLCALAVALPARMGLVSVGADGQLYFGAMCGTAVVLSMAPTTPAWELLPLMVAATCAGGFVWGGIAGGLRAYLGVNETIITILMNYIALRLVEYKVYGDWKDPNNLGWPATISFPHTARFPDLSLFGVGTNYGLVVVVLAAVALHYLVARSRWGFGLTLLRSNPRVALSAGVGYTRNVILVMGLGGLLAGLAGIIQTANVQGHLQPDISNNYGLAGFLVAWLAGQRFVYI